MDWTLPDGVTRLVLIRHAEPSETVAGRCYGKLDVGLSSRGHEHTQRLAAFLAGVPFAALYVSPLRRARETALALTEHHAELEPHIEPALAELSFGLLEGLTYSEIATRFPELYGRWMAAPEEVEFPEGESYAALASRVRPAVSALRRSHTGQTIGIVSHGGVNRVLLADALGLPPTSLFRLDQAYGAVNVVDYWGDTPLVRLMNAGP